MSKAVLIPINPMICEQIASGKKTVDVKTTRPALKPPFKCYIYETRGKTETPWKDEEGHLVFEGRGQVIGEFVCDSVLKIEFSPSNNGEYICEDQTYIEQSCISFKEMFIFLGKEYGYGWHISDLVIYDKPQPLKMNRPPMRWCYIEETAGAG